MIVVSNNAHHSFFGWAYSRSQHNPRHAGAQAGLVWPLVLTSVFVQFPTIWQWSMNHDRNGKHNDFHNNGGQR